MKKNARSFKLGGKTIGPAHEEGGIEAKVGSKPIAEVEGDERIFSKEDTKFIEAEIEKMKAYNEEGDVAGADKCAMDLGYAVAKMVTKQDMRESNQMVEDQAINGFENAGEEY